MHKVTLKNEDAYDLALVVQSIVNEQSEELDFKAIIKLQTLVTTINTAAEEFVSAYDKIADERKKLLDIMQKKVSSFRKANLADLKDGEIDPNFKSNINAYVQAMTDDLNSEIREQISPKFDELYDSVGKKEVSFELEPETQKMLVDNFEKYAKKKYTNKSKMIDVYKAIGGTV